jgi:hypothetical protein
MDIISIFILLLILGLIPAMIAHKKGRSFLGWYIYGILFFIIALVHSLLVSEDTEKFENKQLKEGTMKKCPNCAELVKQEASVCRHCGKSLLPKTAEKQNLEREMKPEVKMESKVDDSILINQLEQLNNLKEKGVLTIDEYDLKAAAIKDKLFGIKKESIDTKVNTQEKKIELETIKTINDIYRERKSITPDNINPSIKTPTDTDENPNKTLYIVFSLIILLLIIVGIVTCYIQNKKESKEDGGNTSELTEFNKTEFSDRNEELIYIREYLKQEAPILAMKLISQKDIDKIKQELIVNGKDFTTREVIDTLLKSSDAIGRLMTPIINNNVSFIQVKEKFKSLPPELINLFIVIKSNKNTIQAIGSSPVNQDNQPSSESNDENLSNKNAEEEAAINLLNAYTKNKAKKTSDEEDTEAESSGAKHYLILAGNKYNSGEYIYAIENYNKAIELYPQYSYAFFMRAAAKYKLNDKEGACSDWYKASELGVEAANGLIIENCPEGD